MKEDQKALIDVYLRKNFIKPPLSIFSKIMGEKSSYNYDFEVIEKLESEFKDFEIYKIKVNEYYLACAAKDGSYAHFALSHGDCICLQSEKSLGKLLSKVESLDDLSPDFLATVVFYSNLYVSHEMILDITELEGLLGKSPEEMELYKEQVAKVKDIVKPPFFLSKNSSSEKELRFYTIYSKDSLLEITAELNKHPKVVNKTLTIFSKTL